MDFTNSAIGKNSVDSFSKESRLNQDGRNLNFPDNKSVRSAKSSRKKTEITASTIISSVEREIFELMQEISVRAHKNKLISISEYLKLLSKKFLQGGESNSTILGLDSNRDTIQSHSSFQKENKSRSNSLMSDENYSNSKFKEEIENLKIKHESEIKLLKDEILSLQSKLNTTGVGSSTPKVETLENKFNSNSIPNNNIELSKLNLKMESVNFLYSEEKIKNGHLVLQIKNLEEALKTLNLEYNSLSFKFGKLQSECEGLEKTINDQRKNNHDNKYKFEDLVKINEDLKKKLIENDNVIKMHNEDIKSILKKGAGLQKYIEELETKLKQVSAELAYKEERLKALRHMNSKLEQKSTQILKKFEAFKLFEEKSNEMSQNSQRMMEMVDELNRKLSIENYEKESIKKNLEITNNEKTKNLAEFEELKRQLNSLKTINEELMKQNTELENKFKRTLGGDSRDTSFILSKERGGTKAFHSSTLNNLNYTMNLTKEGYSQVKLYNYFLIKIFHF